MRIRLVPIFLLLAACGGGGGPPPTLQLSDAFSFSLVRPDAPTDRGVPVGNPFEEEATCELVEAPGGGFAVADGFFPAVAAESGTLTIPVTLTPGAEAAPTAEMVVRFDTGARDAVVRIALDASLESPTLQLDSADVGFGDVLVGESAVRTVLVRNTSLLTPVLVTPATALPADFTFPVTSFTLQPAETAIMRLDYVPTALATHDIEYTIDHDASGDPLRFRITAETTTWVPRIVTDFGAVDVVDGQTEWLEVDVPPHGVSLHLEAITTPDVVLGMNGLEGPGGRVYENEDLTGEFLWFSGVEGVFTSTIPESDRAAIDLVEGGGTYRFRFFVMEGSTSSVNVRAIVRNEPDRVVIGGVIDLNVFLAEGLNLSVSDAPNDTRLQAILADADSILGKQGIAIGDVDYYAITGSSYDNIETDDEFGDLNEQSVQVTRTGLNLFFVLETPGTSLGAASRIGGVESSGTRMSGMIIDFDHGTAAEGAQIVAHEAGHFLGLLHTTEQTGEFDIIDDTLECPATGTGNGCDSEGAGYLMHWRLVSTESVLTDGQGYVMLRHPLVRAGNPSPALAMRAANSPLLAASLPDGWCGTRGCRKAVHETGQ